MCARLRTEREMYQPPEGAAQPDPDLLGACQALIARSGAYTALQGMRQPVHHLSGQQVYFTSNPFPVNRDRAVLHPQGLAHLPFSVACGFDTLSLAHVLDSLVRVSRRVVQDRYV